MTALTMCRRGSVPTAPSVPKRHPLARFTVVGGAATGLQLALFALMQVLVPAFWANVIAWGASTVVGNQVNRVLTFDRHGRAGARQDFAVSSAFSLLSLGATTVALAPVDDDDPVLALAVLIAVNSVVGLVRFLGLRRWFAGHDTPPLPV